MFHGLLHHQAKQERLTLLYVAYILRSALFAFLSLFIPIYYYQAAAGLGFVGNQGWAIMICLMMVVYATNIVAAYSAAKLLRKLGLHHNYLISVMFLSLFIGGIIMFHSLLGLVITAVLLGIHFGFWWTTYHVDFIHNGKPHEFGREVGAVQGLGILAGVLSPLVAGFIVQSYGFLILFSSSSLLVLLLALTLMAIREERMVQPVNLKIMLGEFTANKKDTLSNLALGGESTIAQDLWPLFVFLLLKEPLLVGILATVVTLVSFLSRIYGGLISDSFNKKHLEIFGAFSVSASWTGKFLFPIPFGLVFFEFMHKATSSFFYVSNQALAYVHSLTQNKTAYITSREISIMAGKIIVLFGCLVIIALDISIWSILLLGAISPLFVYFISKSRK
jgi:MFS family permease